MAIGFIILQIISFLYRFFPSSHIKIEVAILSIGRHDSYFVSTTWWHYCKGQANIFSFLTFIRVSSDTSFSVLLTEKKRSIDLYFYLFLYLFLFFLSNSETKVTKSKLKHIVPLLPFGWRAFLLCDSDRCLLLQ